jgi:hypothetical protein
MIFYYYKLHQLDLSSREALMLSVFSASGNKPPCLSAFFISRRWIRSVRKRLMQRGFINSENKVIVNLPRGYNKAFIILYEQLIAEWGLNTALVLCSCKGDLTKLNDSIAKMLGLSRATYFNCKKKLKQNPEFFENIFKNGGEMIDVEAKKKEVQQRHINKFTQQAGRDKGKDKMALLFLALCTSYGYKGVPYPSKADLAKARNAIQNSDIPIGEMLERMVSNWSTLVSLKNKPKLPDLGMLPYVLKELSGLEIAPKRVKTEAPKQDMTDDDIDSYIQDSL